MEQVKSNAGQTLGIIALILGIISLLFAFIPCVGMLAFAPAGIALLLSTIGLVQANKNNGAKGLNLGALIVSVISIIFASIWLIIIVEVSKMDESEIENVVKDVIMEVVDEDLNEDLQTAAEELEKHLETLDSLDVQSDSVKIHIKIDRRKEK